MNFAFFLFIATQIIQRSESKMLNVTIKCPVFNLRKRISILQDGWYLPWLNSDTKTSTTKIFTDHNFIYDILKPYLPENEYCDIWEPDQFKMMNPSAIWLNDKQMFLAVARINVNKNKSFLYSSWYDSNWNEVITEDFVGNTSVPGILPIEIPSLYLLNAGPEDPRIFWAFKNQLFVAFNMYDYDERRKMWVYNFNTTEFYPFSILEHMLRGYYGEKNWTPLIVDDEHLYFVYNYKDFQLIDCAEKGKNCLWINGVWDRVPEGLKGGSPYMQYKNTSYYVNLGYSHVFVSQNNITCEIYRPCLTLVRKNEDAPFLELIYTSEPMDFANQLFLKPLTRYASVDEIDICGDARIMMALSIARWDYENDIVDMTININDTIPLALKVSGVGDVIDEVIMWDGLGKLPKENNCAERLLFLEFGTVQPAKRQLNKRKRRPRND
ncbi:unnamed protein product [Blepharisma stoltei]|uniref:Uncharacterized protein n=1 Tax=Blepharisma stoltei TaxID=1481888 RepID=A0AAU9JPU2_9CILI|nr:unnamed protein product [Blepharisma stoltei]